MTEPHQELLARHAFVVDISGIGPVGYFLTCEGLEMEVEVLSYAEGGNNEEVHQLPGRVTYPPLRLSNGMTASKTLSEWFNKTRSKADPQELTITLKLEGSDVERKWTFADAFPSKWTGPTLDTASSSISTETLTIVHGGLKEA